MTFANPLPPGVLALVVIAALTVGWLAYRRAPLTAARRAPLAALRVAILLLLVLFLMRPVARTLEQDARDAVVPVLFDASRSMRIEDAGGLPRIERARALFSEELLPLLKERFQVEVLAFGDGLQSAGIPASATGRRSDIARAISAARDRFRGRPVAGLILISDGADTGESSEPQNGGGPPVFPVPVGSPTAGRDREVLSVTAAEAPLDDARVELAATIVAHGHGRTPVVARLLENGRPVEVREGTPAADGAPIRVTFQASPASGAPAVYTVEVPAAAGELVPENNRRSVLVQPPSRRRRVLLVEGAPGFEHSFLKRALAADPGLEVDSVVRKGRNEQGADTYYVQAARARAAALASGYPQSARDLFRYDALVLGNVEGAQLGTAQIAATREFVARRGGGLLVLGTRSFMDGGLANTPLEEVLPVQLQGRGRAQAPATAIGAGNRVALTSDGELHPIMQLGAGAEDTRKRWGATPALASVAPLGDPRPGATVLAASSGAPAGRAAVVAVQRYGEGRSMIFAGEASWRWRMMLPASDRSYDTFWRQAVRWLASTGRDPAAISVPIAASAGDLVPLRIAVRDEEFQPLDDAAVDVRVTAPDGRIEQLRAIRDGDDVNGRYVVHFRAQQPGVHRVLADARHAGGASSAAASFLVGGADAEMSDPRLNLRLLHRLAADSGGRVIGAGEGQALVDALLAATPAAALAVRRDLWHTGWSFAAILLLLTSEWLLRRRFGLK